MARNLDDLSEDSDFMHDEVEQVDSYEVLPGGYIGGGLTQLDPTYKDINVDATETELKSKSKDVIKKIVNVYFKAGEMEEDDYIKSLQTIEAMNLENMLVQVKYSSHMISSLMRRLNESGTTDTQLFRLIMDAQNHALQLTMTVANYVRNLPTHFKSLKFELLPGLPTELAPGNTDEQRQIGNLEPDTDDPMFINRPQMGTRDLLKCIEQAKEEGARIIQETERDDPHNYNPSEAPLQSDEVREARKKELLEENSDDE